MRWLYTLIGVGLVAAAAAGPAREARAQGGGWAVVEFFTSQGCSSCPPADEIFARLAREPGVIALAFHVDYWDYLGWKDPFGRPENTARQRAYAKAQGLRSIYTPQMIVAGEDILIGHDEEAVAARIAAHAARPAPVALELARTGGGLTIRVAPDGAPVGPAEIHLVRFEPQHAMTVEAGENAGYHHEFVNIVTDLVTIGRWNGREALEIDHPLGPGGGTPLAVVVQTSRHGPILAAAKLP